jgi:hypothetical protein
MIDWIRARGPRQFQHHIDVEIVSGALPKTWSPQAK